MPEQRSPEPRRHVVCSHPLPAAAEQRRLEQLFDVELVAADRFAEALATADGAVVLPPTPVTRAIVASAPRLRIVTTVSSGFDHVDVDALRERGIELVSGTGAGPWPVAEWVVWAALSLRRRLFTCAMSFMADGVWNPRPAPADGHELSSAVVGIVGFGHVGSAVVRTLGALADSFLVYDPFVTELPERCTRVASITELCERSDIVTVHTPLNDSTRLIVGAAELRRIGPHGILINAARGAVVDQDALVEVLRSGELGGAAIDCFDPEPAPEQLVADLLATGRVLLTPHAAGYSIEATENLSRWAVDALASVLLGGD